MDLDTKVTILDGVGPVIARGLERLGIKTIADLLMYYPRRWEDYSKISKISALTPGMVSLRATVERIAVKRTSRRHLLLTEAILSDDTGTTKAVWFNQPYIINNLKKGQEYIFRGDFGFRAGNLGFTQPAFEPVAQFGPVGKIKAIYPENKQINSNLISKLVSSVLDFAPPMPEPLPPSVLSQQKLISADQAWRSLHFPASMKQLQQARDRLEFEEIFFMMLTGRLLRAEIESNAAPPIKFDVDLVKQVISQLPFKLTDAQRSATWQIFQDIELNRPMNRLLIGDVGSGKTIVAVLASVMVIRNQYQAVLMVPTEILARQHAQSIAKLLLPLGIKPELLIGGLSAAEKKAAKLRIATGEADLIIGTHALLSQDVEFAKLGLVTIDEQHRFGVAQRKILKEKSKLMPHLLSMTATPIPRSLSLVIYGDLNITLIDKLPPGRKPIKTQLMTEKNRLAVYSEIDQIIGQGRQVYIVCPLIEESDTSGKKSVTSEYARLKKTIFAHRRIGLIHGRMTPAQKQTVMSDFVNGSLDILIATSVIEVGVDVPNATVMIIEDADRYGLAALHQLRGRVGRANHQSYCYIFTTSDNEQTIERLSALTRSSDGFRLAQIDLSMRGPGEVYGQRQHGRDLRQLANIFDSVLIERVKSAVDSFVSQENMLKYDQMVARVNALKSITTLD